ncbi:MAG: PilZ domain-containing protein [Nitrospirae bacterium]|nr:PilZ domain-containing protein [Candidatus Manganitrophaceae bacterium]
MIEKRKHIRVTIKSIAEVILPEGDFDQAYVGGISRGGLEMYTGKEMKRETPVKITLHFLLEGQEVTEAVQGAVKWSASFKNAFVSGIEFSSVLSAEANPNLVRCIEQAELFYK